MSKAAKSIRHLSDSYVNQISVLKVLGGSGRGALQPRQLDISQISELSGLRDEKEIQRYLYILEGHKLVAPYPDGDFTSKIWHITDEGIRTIKAISQDLPQ